MRFFHYCSRSCWNALLFKIHFLNNQETTQGELNWFTLPVAENIDGLELANLVMLGKQHNPQPEQWNQQQLHDHNHSAK